MPTINKKPIQVISLKRERKDERMKLYNNSQWRNLRKIYIQSHPLCEKCLERGIVNGEHLNVHHKLSPFDYGLSDMERYSRLLDYNNLMTLCEECHGALHMEMLKKNMAKNDKI